VQTTAAAAIAQELTTQPTESFTKTPITTTTEDAVKTTIATSTTTEQSLETTTAAMENPEFHR
jgi:hypothetical protein